MAEARAGTKGEAADSAIAVPATSADVADAELAGVKRITQPSVAPRDDCAGEPGWRAYRAALTDAVARRDTAALRTLVEPDLQLDFGGGAGIDTMIAELPDGKDGRVGLWRELETVLALGCGIGGSGDERFLAMPRAFTLDLGDPFYALFPVRTPVVMRAAPSADAPPVAVLDWAAVLQKSDLDGAQGRDWLHVVARDGTSGYVPTADMRSMIDRRALIQRVDGRLRMTSFIAGD